MYKSNVSIIFKVIFLNFIFLEIAAEKPLELAIIRLSNLKRIVKYCIYIYMYTSKSDILKVIFCSLL